MIKTPPIINAVANRNFAEIVSPKINQLKKILMMVLMYDKMETCVGNNVFNK